MKKFLAIVMCLTMALAMMTVTSFAADLQIGAAEAKTAAPGEVVEIPVYITDAGNEITLGITQVTIQAPAGVEYEVVPGVIPASGISDVDSEIVLYDDAGKTYNATSPVVTLKVTAPAEAGTYTFKFEGTQELFDEAYDQIFDMTFTDVVIKVEAAPTQGDPVMTVVPAEEGTSLMVLEPVGTPVEMGVVYQGEGEYNGVAFKSLAPAGAKAAVKVIGLEGTFAPYANY